MFVSTVKPHTTYDGRNGWLYTAAFLETPTFFTSKHTAVAVAKRDLQADKVHHLKTYTLRGRVDYNGYSPQVRKIKKLEEEIAVLKVQKDGLKKSVDYLRGSYYAQEELYENKLYKEMKRNERLLKVIEDLLCTD